MKTYLLIFCFLIAFIPVHLSAQSDKEDVIYTKNGSVYRGTIIEQIPNVSYKIEIAGGSVILINAADVASVARETKHMDEAVYVRRRQRLLYEFHYRPSGYFFQAQLEAEVPEAGFRLVNGYKFNQFAFLGLGLGVDGVISDLHGNTDYAGAYLPVYIYYGGDMLHQQITPFYSVEAGYAWRPDVMASGSNYYYSGSSGPIGGHGGFMAGAALGVRFYTRRRVHFDLSAHVNLKMSTENYENDIYNQGGNTYQYFYSANEILIIPGFRIGLGF